MLNHGQRSEFHSPLHMSIFIESEGDGCEILTASVSETNGIVAVCRQSKESNTVHNKHTQNIDTNRQG
jgi:hypothetical protein